MFDLVKSFFTDPKVAILALRAMFLVVGTEMVSGHIPGGAGYGAFLMALGAVMPSSGFSTSSTDKAKVEEIAVQAVQKNDGK